MAFFSKPKRLLTNLGIYIKTLVNQKESLLIQQIILKHGLKNSERAIN